MLIIFISSASAQEETDFPLEYELYFNTFSSGEESRILSVQEDASPIDVFSTDHSIFAYSWSPDGQSIAIIRNNPETRTKLLEVFNKDFHHIEQWEVTIYQNDLTGFPMVWSDSENLLLVSSSETGMPQVMMVSLSSPEEITQLSIPVAETEELAQIYWSPDGGYMLYQTHTLSSAPTPTNAPPIRQPQPYNLYLLEIETLQSTFISDTSYRSCVAWSPDNHSIASISNSFRDTEYPYMLRSNQIEIYDLESGAIETIELQTDINYSLGCPMAWSNDGQQIALETTRIDNENQFESGVAVIDVASGDFQTLGMSHLESYNIISLTWSPDDSWIAVETLYNAYRDIRLFSYTTGNEVTIMLDGVPLFSPSWRFTEE